MRRPDPIPELKAQMTAAVRRLMDGWDTPELTCMLHTSESRVSKLRAGKTSDVSLGRLIEIAAQLGAEVRIAIVHPDALRRAARSSKRSSAEGESGGVPRKA